MVNQGWVGNGKQFCRDKTVDKDEKLFEQTLRKGN
jgi:hypothetical protein